MGRCRRHLVVPVEVAPWLHGGGDHIALKDDAVVGLVDRDLHGAIEQRLVLDHPVDLEAT